jgi:hypothetical protein
MATLLALAMPVRADAPVERYHVEADQIAPRVLEDAIGVLSLNAGVKGGRFLTRFRHEAAAWVVRDTLDLLRETTPVSNFGYDLPPDRRSVSNFRYPVVAVDSSYVEVVIDPVKDERAWLSTGEIERRFYHGLVRFDGPGPMKGGWGLDLLHLGDDENRMLYAVPDSQAARKSLRTAGKPLWKALLVENGYVQIGVDRCNGEPVEPIGWLRVRDDAGRLWIWVKMVDCY